MIWFHQLCLIPLMINNILLYDNKYINDRNKYNNWIPKHHTFSHFLHIYSKPWALCSNRCLSLFFTSTLQTMSFLASLDVSFSTSHHYPIDIVFTSLFLSHNFSPHFINIFLLVFLFEYDCNNSKNIIYNIPSKKINSN